MSDTERVGNHDREQAVTWLQEHQAAGRISSTEYEERAIQARQARTRADLAPLFTDLPEPRPALPAAPSTPAGSVDRDAALATPGLSPDGRRSGLVPERFAHMLMAASPILAVILFFVTGSWLWFLAIPLMGVIVYGPDGRPGRERNRGRKR
jgi:hypothetical protein